MLGIEPFDKYPYKYDRWFIKNKFTYQSELLALKAQIPHNRHSIEIGVGSGRFARPLDIKLGVEPSIKMQMLSKKRKIDLVNSVAEKLPFKSSVFELVLIVTTICFVDNIELSFKETFRVLKKDGFLIVGFIDRNSSIGKLYEQSKQSNVFYKFANFYSVNEVIILLEDAGFKDFIFSQTLFQPLNTIKKIEPYRKGYGKGSFVVIKAKK